MRILEMKRLLKPTGSIYLHCDSTAGHYLKLTMDTIFGNKNFRNEIIWHYGKMSNTKDNFPRNHDILLRYTKSDRFTFNPQKGEDSEYRNRFINFLTGNQILYGSVKHKKDKLVTGRISKIEKTLGRTLKDNDVLFDFDKEFKYQSDVIYVPIIKGNAKERLGYPTQKPLALLYKVIQASSNEGDIVFDPFAGCTTTCVAAKKLQREWVAIDISPKAGELIKVRLQNELALEFFDGEVTTNPPTRSPDDRTEDELFPDTKQLPYNHPQIRQYLFGKQSGHCNACQQEMPFKVFEVDHIVPRVKGGKDNIENLQLLCTNCNKRKGSMDNDEFIKKIREEMREKQREMEKQLKRMERLYGNSGR